MENEPKTTTVKGYWRKRYIAVPVGQPTEDQHQDDEGRWYVYDWIPEYQR